MYTHYYLKLLINLIENTFRNQNQIKNRIIFINITYLLLYFIIKFLVINC